jgi:hypothetical protein
MYAMQKLLWDVRRDPSVAQRFRSDPESVLDDYEIAGPLRTALRELDVKGLYDAGANPYLLYFCAIQLGIPRQDYYARLRGERT